MSYKEADKAKLKRQSVVAYVIAMPGCMQKDMVDNLKISSGMISHIVNHLVREGLLKTNTGETGGGARYYFFNQSIPHVAIQKKPTTPKVIPVAVPEKPEKKLREVTRKDTRTMTQQEFTKRYGFCENYPHNLIYDKKITGHVVGTGKERRLVLDTTSVEAWAAKRRAAGIVFPFKSKPRRAAKHSDKLVEDLIEHAVRPPVVVKEPKKRKKWVYTKARQESVKKMQAAKAKKRKGFFGRLFG